MNKHLVMLARLGGAAVGASLQYLGEEILARTNMLIAPAEALDNDADSEGDPIMGAESWLAGLRVYHAVDAYEDSGDNCGNVDCRTCWINATGAADR